MKKILLTALFFVPTISFAAIPDFPMAFWGAVSVDEVAVPAGSIIRVYDDVIKVGEVVVQEAGIYGYTEPTKQKLIVSEGVGILTFTIQSPTINNGVETKSLTPITHAGFVSGETVQKDLNFDILLEIIVSSGGGSSSSGGGGGSKKKAEAPIATALVLGVSTSTQSDEEQRIALQKQLIEVLTILISLLKQKLLLI